MLLNKCVRIVYNLWITIFVGQNNDMAFKLYFIKKKNSFLIVVLLSGFAKIRGFLMDT